MLPVPLRKGSEVGPPGWGLHWGEVLQTPVRKEEAVLVKLVAAKTLPVHLLAT